MSRFATPILYLNMGGEILYVLKHRLQAQKISPDKSAQVLNDVSLSLLYCKQLENIFLNKSPMSIFILRPILERIVLCSIMKLSLDSMDKLFDLIIEMVKFQLTVATGPREIILCTLNHIDTIQNLSTSPIISETIKLAHQFIINMYGNMTHDELWQIRSICLQELQNYNVKVSILLKLGYQNDDATFNRPLQNYNENYEEKKEILGNLTIREVTGDENVIGSLALVGNRVTMLGKNILMPMQDKNHQEMTKSNNQEVKKLNQQINKERRASISALTATSNAALRQEIESLATQLGVEESISKRPFSLHLFSYEDVKSDNQSSIDKADNKTKDNNASGDDSKNKNTKTDVTLSPYNNEYKNNLIGNINIDFAEHDTISLGQSVDFMNLLDTMK